MRRGWWVAVLLLGCARVDGLPTDDGAVDAALAGDALVGRIGGRTALDAAQGADSAPRNVAFVDAGAPALGGCHPGERLALCTVCGVDGQPRPAENDDACPPVDCGPLATYEEAAVDDGTACYRVAQTVQGGNCADEGLCVQDPRTRCQPGERTEVARAVGPCQHLAGCAAGQPTVQNAITGTACNGPGSCLESGMCSIAPGDCATLPGRSCGEGVQNDGTAYCDLYIRGNGGNTSCAQFCQANGTSCIRSWSDHDDTCEHEGSTDCNQQQGDLICRCVRPAAP